MKELREFLASAPDTDCRREQRVFEEFQRRQAHPRRRAIADGRGHIMDECNIEVTMPGGAGRSPIYLTAHHDHVPKGDGIVDNWSGVVALFQLYERFIDRPLHRPLVLVSFALEELGLHGITTGSEHYVRQLGDQSIHANVNLECLGPGPLHCWTYRDGCLPMPSDTPRARYDDLVSDAQSFHQIAGCPTIVFDGIAAVKERIIHTERDTIDAIDMNHYVRSLDQIEAYLRDLDSLSSCDGLTNGRSRGAGSHRPRSPLRKRTLRVRRRSWNTTG